MSCLFDLLIPGVGLVGDVLAKALQLCNEMKEGQDACRRVYGKLSEILAFLRQLDEQGLLPPSEKIYKYTIVLRRYLRYLERYRGQNIVGRLPKHHEMVNELGLIHEDIDMLLKLFNLTSAVSMLNWKQQWQINRQNNFCSIAFCRK
ncbi:Serine/threonine protein kinase [Phytophthora megakarya]|uniref:Serine/threonine protein kinase n=1 Tax=Phytophthora megakarya TaxID=4795 RepID=A0A225ULH2_9STRA|nr:Serine/threonine protein kinase [Phytophthora megakarya]